MGVLEGITAHECDRHNFSQLTRTSIVTQFMSLIIDRHDESFVRLFNAPKMISIITSNCCPYWLFSSHTFVRSRSTITSRSINRRTAFCSHNWGIIVGEKAKFLIRPTVALIVPQCSFRLLSRSSFTMMPMPYDFLIASRASFSRSWRAVTCRSVHN